MRAGQGPIYVLKDDFFPKPGPASGRVASRNAPSPGAIHARVRLFDQRSTYATLGVSARRHRQAAPRTPRPAARTPAPPRRAPATASRVHQRFDASTRVISRQHHTHFAAPNSVASALRLVIMWHDPGLAEGPVCAEIRNGEKPETPLSVVCSGASLPRCSMDYPQRAPATNLRVPDRSARSTLAIHHPVRISGLEAEALRRPIRRALETPDLFTIQARRVGRDQIPVATPLHPGH